MNNQSGTLWQVIERQTMKLKNKKKTIKRLKKLGIDLVLHGHLHETNEYHRKGIKFINSGGSILGYPNEIRITEINASNMQIITRLRKFLYDNSKPKLIEEQKQIQTFNKIIKTRKELVMN
jgi:predicted phosphodiesterase